VVISLFGLAILLSLFMPAYIDDLFYPLTSARAGYDGWYSLNAFPQCGETFLVAIPVALLPGRAFSWAIHTTISDFYDLRISAIIILLAWIVYTAWFLKSCLLPAQPLRYVLAGVVSFAGLGRLPFLLLYSRPETAMILAITVYVSLPFLIDKFSPPSLKIVLLLALLFLFMTSWFVSAHPKALLYAPLVLLSSLWVCRWHRITGVVLTLATAFTLYQGWHDFWRLKIACPGSPAGEKHQEISGLSPAQFFSDRGKFLHQLKLNIMAGNEYIHGINFSSGYGLPAAPHNIMESIASPLITCVIIGFLLGITYGMVLMVFHVFRHRALGHPAFLLSLTLLGAFAAQWALQTMKLQYNFGLVWMTLMLCGITIAIYITRQTGYWEKPCLTYGFFSLLIVAFFSESVLLATYIPATMMSAQDITPDDVGQEMWGGVSGPFNYQALKERILEVAKSCRIAPDNSSKHVMIDFGTYLALKNTYQPYRVDFLYHEFDQPEQLFPFLKKAHSSGIVTFCRTLPENIRPYAQQEDGVCCISQEQINTIPAEGAQ
jgi:hypothetical protein